MNTQLKPQLHKHSVMQRLYSLGLGTHWCGWFKGYITIEGNEDKYDVMWTSGKDTHDPMTGNSISVEFTENGCGLVFKSAITMHTVRDESEKEQCIKFIEKKIAYAYRKNVA
jgi:hypothetical protein